jgi:hypothetical protein
LLHSFCAPLSPLILIQLERALSLGIAGDSKKRGKKAAETPLQSAGNEASHLFQMPTTTTTTTKAKAFAGAPASPAPSKRALKKQKLSASQEQPAWERAK